MHYPRILREGLKKTMQMSVRIAGLHSVIRMRSRSANLSAATSSSQVGNCSRLFTLFDTSHQFEKRTECELGSKLLRKKCGCKEYDVIGSGKKYTERNFVVCRVILVLLG